MKKNLVLIGALVVVVGVVLAFTIASDEDPSGLATGVPNSALWEKLGDYQDSYLSAWDSALDEQRPEAIDVLEAWNELAYMVTGRTGFWRRVVGNEWFGCQQEPDEDACIQLAEMKSEFAKWDDMQKKIQTLSPRKARRFLRRNEKRMMSYIDRYVPADMSASGMRETAAYESYLAEVLD